MHKIVKLTYLVIILSLALITSVSANEKDHSEKNVIVLSPEQQKVARIVVSNLTPKRISKYLIAPGEIIPNSNLTTNITSRVSAKVIKRYINEGQHIKQGEPIATLSSIDVSKNQGDLILAFQEWNRVRDLGKDAVSAKRYSEAQVAYQSAYQTALASGMSEADIAYLLQTEKISPKKGEIVLTAPRNGTAFNVNFTEGELVEPGKVLLQIVDENTVWVDAKLPPDLAYKLKIGDKAFVKVGNLKVEGNVVQILHQLDETTRTRSIRIEVSNTKDLLHPGQYVNCEIETDLTPPVLAVPVEAIVRTNDGDSAIYVEAKQNEFHPEEIKVLEVVNNQAIIEGIPSGTKVVTNGSFFIHAELNKKGIDPHSH